jgi:hypothetical protein
MACGHSQIWELVRRSRTYGPRELS